MAKYEVEYVACLDPDGVVVCVATCYRRWSQTMAAWPLVDATGFPCIRIVELPEAEGYERDPETVSMVWPGTSGEPTEAPICAPIIREYCKIASEA